MKSFFVQKPYMEKISHDLYDSGEIPSAGVLELFTVPLGYGDANTTRTNMLLSCQLPSGQEFQVNEIIVTNSAPCVINFFVGSKSYATIRSQFAFERLPIQSILIQQGRNFFVRCESEKLGNFVTVVLRGYLFRHAQ